MEVQYSLLQKVQAGVGSGGWCWQPGPSKVINRTSTGQSGFWNVRSNHCPRSRADLHEKCPHEHLTVLTWGHEAAGPVPGREHSADRAGVQPAQGFLTYLCTALRCVKQAFPEHCFLGGGFFFYLKPKIPGYSSSDFKENPSYSMNCSQNTRVGMGGPSALTCNRLVFPDFTGREILLGGRIKFCFTPAAE